MSAASGASGSPAPRFSVIVPVYRHWTEIPDLLAALAAQNLDPGRFEVVIVDNGPPAERPALPLPARARIVACAAPGSYAARNAGAAAARGDWLVFTDADCRPRPGWLAAFAHASNEAAAEPPGTLLAGPVAVTAPPDPNPCEIYELVRGIPQAAYVARGYAATANLAVPAQAFRALGGFDPARFSGGDAEFCRRAGRAGLRLRLVAAAVVEHPVSRADWPALAAKARRIKGGQIAAGPPARRVAWTLRTLAPPLRDARAYLRSGQPWRHRRIALALRFRLWGVELAEAARLLMGGAPERR